MTDMRTRLAKALERTVDEQFPDRTNKEPDDWMDWLPFVDAILRELMEPTNGMWRAGFHAIPGNKSPLVAQWQAMLQHILDESRSASIPHRGTVNEQDAAR